MIKNKATNPNKEQIKAILSKVVSFIFIFNIRFVKYLFNYLNKIDSIKSASLNQSDRANPRRLIRAIEISSSKKQTHNPQSTTHNFLQIGLTAPRDCLYNLVNQRVLDRITVGAAVEDPGLAANPRKWQNQEHGIIRHQLTWFKVQPGITWFDISQPDWKRKATNLIENWYNQLDAER